MYLSFRYDVDSVLLVDGLLHQLYSRRLWVHGLQLGVFFFKLLTVKFWVFVLWGVLTGSILLRLQENGSYQQRVLAEYIREIEARAESLIAAFQSSPSR